MTNKEFIKVAADSELVKLLTHGVKIVCEDCVRNNGGKCPGTFRNVNRCKYPTYEDMVADWLYKEATLKW